MNTPDANQSHPAYDQWLTALSAHQNDLKQNAGFRSLRAFSNDEKPYCVKDVAGNTLINLSSNDYLALATHPDMLLAAKEAGNIATGGKASRLAGGDRPDIQQLESRFAAFKKAEAALLFPTGYMANLAALSCLTKPIAKTTAKNLICLDKYCHASLIDGARLSEQTLRTYPHGPAGLTKLQRLLADYRKQSPSGQAFIVTDTIFSMDGDAANLKALSLIGREFGAILIIDEAHGTGIYGSTGSGLAETMDDKERLITISTASKAMGALGGLVTGPRPAIDQIINHGRALIYTTSVPPAQVASIDCALTLIEEEPWRRDRVKQMALQLREALAAHTHFKTALGPKSPGESPIIPLITGSAASAIALSEALYEQGFLATAIRPPTVPPNQSRVRISLRADLPDHDMHRLTQYLLNYAPRIKRNHLEHSHPLR